MPVASTKPRYLPSWPLPAYAFIPGVNEHPHLEAPPAAESDLLNYALDLFNHAYFWESHVYFEAIWNARNREGAMANFCKAMIKLGAAGVKRSQKQNENAIVHFKRAKELVEELIKDEESVYLAFDLHAIVKQIDSSLSGDLNLFEIHPVPDANYHKC